MVKVKPLEAPPPGAGLKTVTWAVPAVAMSAAEREACNWPALTYVVVRLDPFQFTTDPLTNPDPLTVRVNAAPPTVVAVGDREVIDGTGLFVCQLVAVTTPPVPEVAAEVPSEREAMVPETEIGIDPVLVAEARVTVTTARTPLATALLFIPVARQIICPVRAVQLRTLPAAVAAAPGAALMAVTSGVKARVHWRAAGEVPVALRFRFRLTVPPMVVLPEASAKDVVWPWAAVPNRTDEIAARKRGSPLPLRRMTIKIHR
jgi:hypothetical protein